jgi:predicted DsbA family dithiol-disulfide isomerase
VAKKPKRKTLKNKCDKLWSLIIRMPRRCEWCGAGNRRFEAAHIVSRTYSKTRHWLMNGLCLCSSCHRKAHAMPTLFSQFVEDHLGKSALETIHREAQRTDYKVDYEQVLKGLKEAFNESYPG